MLANKDFVGLIIMNAGPEGMFVGLWLGL